MTGQTGSGLWAFRLDRGPLDAREGEDRLARTHSQAFQKSQLPAPARSRQAKAGLILRLPSTTNVMVREQNAAPRSLNRNRMIRVMAAFAAAVTAGTLSGQRFDVASIKPSQLDRTGGEGSRRDRVSVSPAGVTLENATLGDCIEWAWSVRFYQVSGPGWPTQDRFDIVAKNDTPQTTEQLRAMLQSLLADRFRLQLHRAPRKTPVYELVTREKPITLPESQTDSYPGPRVIDGSFVFQHVTLAQFAEGLSGLAAIDRPVLDKTGIAGIYDITLKSAARAMLEDPSSIFSAIENIGFALESRRGQVETLIVDHAERPKGN